MFLSLSKDAINNHIKNTNYLPNARKKPQIFNRLKDAVDVINNIDDGESISIVVNNVKAKGMKIMCILYYFDLYSFFVYIIICVFYNLEVTMSTPNICGYNCSDCNDDLEKDNCEKHPNKKVIPYINGRIRLVDGLDKNGNVVSISCLMGPNITSNGDSDMPNKVCKIC